MKRHLLRLALGTAMVLAGCVPTLHPLYTDKDLIFDSNLVGQWAEADSKETWSFAKDGEKAYRLTYRDSEGKKGDFKVHLLKLGDLKFLDLFPDEDGLKSGQRSDFYYFHYVPVHSYIRVLQVSPNLRLAVMKNDWLNDLLKADPKAIRHERVEDGFVLTASTPELQAFVVKHARTEAAWGDPSNMERREDVLSRDSH